MRRRLPIGQYLYQAAFMQIFKNSQARQAHHAQSFQTSTPQHDHIISDQARAKVQIKSFTLCIYQACVVSSVCHGAVGLLNITLNDGSHLLAGKKATGFSNEEERLAELDPYVPFLTEDEMVKRGASYQKASAPWLPFAIADQRVVTGQNPASGGAVADLVLAILST
jgi:hypothetical protein